MINVMLSGAGGAMGRVLAGVIAGTPDMTVTAGFDSRPVEAEFPVYTDPAQCTQPVDVIIDFSHFSAFDTIFGYACEKRIPIVVATTGLSDENMAAIQAASADFPIFKTANMSLGINVIAKVLTEIAGNLAPGFDIEIIEKHHNKKADAPSGTALLLADAINAGLEDKKQYTTVYTGKRQKEEIGIHAIRGGTIPGEHTVLFAGNDELIEIKHTALSKKIFANGAVTAARFLIDQQPGLYDMQDTISQ